MKASGLKSPDVTVYATHLPSGEICTPPTDFSVSNSSIVGTWRVASGVRLSFAALAANGPTKANETTMPRIKVPATLSNMRLLILETPCEFQLHRTYRCASFLGCGDLSPLWSWARGAGFLGCFQRSTTAVTGHRTPKS